MNNLFYESKADERYYFNFHVATHNVISAHFHSNTELLFVKKGQVKVSINGKEAILKEGDISVSNGFDVHYYLGEKDSEVYVLVHGKSYKSKTPLDDKKKVFSNFLFKRNGSEEIFDLLSMFYKHFDNSVENFELKIGFINYLYGLLIKYYPDEIVSKTSTGNDFSQILVYISENSNKDIKIEEVSKMFGYSKNHFSMIFNKFIGMHFRDYINRLRLEKMEEIIKNDPNISICDAALSCGFNSLNTYYRAKKRFE